MRRGPSSRPRTGCRRPCCARCATATPSRRPSSSWPRAIRLGRLRRRRAAAAGARARRAPRGQPHDAARGDRGPARRRAGETRRGPWRRHGRRPTEAPAQGERVRPPGVGMTRGPAARRAGLPAGRRAGRGRARRPASRRGGPAAWLASRLREIGAPPTTAGAPAGRLAAAPGHRRRCPGSTDAHRGGHPGPGGAARAAHRDPGAAAATSRTPTRQHAAVVDAILAGDPAGPGWRWRSTATPRPRSCAGCSDDRPHGQPEPSMRTDPTDPPMTAPTLTVDELRADSRRRRRHRRRRLHRHAGPAAGQADPRARSSSTACSGTAPRAATTCSPSTST